LAPIRGATKQDPTLILPSLRTLYFLPLCITRAGLFTIYIYYMAREKEKK
jgi:hypothetical protein